MSAYVWKPVVPEIILSLCGGALISAALSLNLLLKGRHTAGHGIFSGIITGDAKTVHWKTSFYLGMIVAVTLLYMLLRCEKDSCFMNVAFFDSPERSI